MKFKNGQNGFIGKVLLLGLFGVILLGALFKSHFSAPETFPAPYRLTIEQGQTLFSISEELYVDGVIRSARLFEIFMLSLGSDKNISEGEYYFAEPMNVFRVALRIAGKDFGIDRDKVTFPEGFTNKEMAERFVTIYPEFDKATFLKLAEDEQGYLFPDTYSFFPSLKPELAIEALKNNFSRKIRPLEDDIAASGKTLEDIIIMASIIEKEANGAEDRATVSGILWKRLEMDMALQVDAPFLFLLGKQSKDLTVSDLAIKSPYNTYINKGLPPTPINNPGLAAIEAAIHPKASPYLYYLHDNDGGIHYASTYDGHKQNIAKYLR